MNDAGIPTVGAVVGTEIVTVGAGLTVTFAVPLIWFVPLVAATAVTVAVWYVESVVVACPFWSDVALAGETEPTSVENETSTPGSALLFASNTVAATVDVPPAPPRFRAMR